MQSLAHRAIASVLDVLANVTVGTAIVLVHVAIAHRRSADLGSRRADSGLRWPGPPTTGARPASSAPTS